ncbi:hypothetical protein ACF08A_25755 [Streptomyces cellulosae]
MTTAARPHLEVVAGALEDWWITADPAQPFECRAVAEAVEAHLITSGYRIAPVTKDEPMTTPARTTCDASHATGFAEGGVLGPCILRHGHDGPLHKDARGATWLLFPASAPAASRPSRATLAVTVFLVLACVAGGAGAALQRDWGWVVAAVIGAWVLLLELRDEAAARRAARRTRP